MSNEGVRRYKICPTKQMRSYLDFEEADPFLLRILTIIEGIKDKEDPDRIILRSHDMSRAGKLKRRIMKGDE